MKKLNALLLMLALLAPASLHAQTRTDGPSPELMRELSASHVPLRAALALDAAFGLQVAAPTNVLVITTNIVTITNTFVAPAPPATAQSAVQSFIDAVKGGSTNWYVAAYGIYAKGLTHKYGFGVAEFYPLSTYVVSGLRVDYCDGAFWMPAATATLQMPLQLVSWLNVTPFVIGGVAFPLSGASFGNLRIPGQVPTDNNGQPTAIVGAGAAVHIGSISGVRLALAGSMETWSNFPGQQYRLGVLGFF